MKPKKPNAEDNSSAILGISTQPLVINPDANSATKQRQYRRDAIERYVKQMREEGREIGLKKMKELEDEYTTLTIELRKAGEII
jgi:hypothetical protein